jgi:hypothetical protein
MAILTTVSQEGGQPKFYEVPDDQLQQYELETEQKADAGGETPDGKMPAVLMGGGGGGLQANSSQTICYTRRGNRIWWWYC